MDNPLPSMAELVTIAKGASEIAMSRWSLGKPAQQIWDKEPGHPVCASDIAVNQYLHEKLTSLYPYAGWLSEETANDASIKKQDEVWIIDPIDGTRDYIHGRKGWAISIALVRKGIPVLAILDAPALNECWTATQGRGAYCNDRPIKASTRSIFKGARIPMSQIDLGVSLTPVQYPNSIALKMAMVADNRADIVATTKWANEWDIAAAHLIAMEAGANVTDARGKDLIYVGTTGKACGMLCCAPLIRNEAVKRLAPYIW